MSIEELNADTLDTIAAETVAAATAPTPVAAVSDVVPVVADVQISDPQVAAKPISIEIKQKSGWQKIRGVPTEVLLNTLMIFINSKLVGQTSTRQNCDIAITAVVLDTEADAIIDTIKEARGDTVRPKLSRPPVVTAKQFKALTKG